MKTLMIRNVVVGRQAGLDVRVGKRWVEEVARKLAVRPGEDVLDGDGGALIPGLHDHHVHLRAVVGARQSVDVSAVADAAEFDRVLAASADGADVGSGSDRWVRVTGWHELRAGALDRRRLDALAGAVPVRVQHRSGSMWVLNSVALERLSAGQSRLAGIERDDRDEPTGRLFRLDDWLRDRLGSGDATLPFETGLKLYAAECARLGVTGWTDATPGREQADVNELSCLAGAGVFGQRLVLMAPPGVEPPQPGQVTTGPVKVMLDDTALPDVREFASQIESAHRSGSAVAVHCVTAEQLVVAVAAFEMAGTPDRPAGSDRIEHAGVVPPGYAERLARLGLAVVTQPGFIGARGDVYRREVSPAEQDWLYPAASLMRAGVSVAAGTDAPFGPGDPWQCIASAVTRRCPDGKVLGWAERVPASRALRMFLAAPDDVRAIRTVAPGQRADLCLLHSSVRDALASLPAPVIRATVLSGIVAEN